MEDIYLNRLNKNILSKCSGISGLENLETALSRRKGAILISGHFYANRLCKHFLPVDDLFCPLFVSSGDNVRLEIKEIPGIYFLSGKYLVEEAKEIRSLGIQAVLLYYRKQRQVQILLRLRE